MGLVHLKPFGSKHRHADFCYNPNSCVGHLSPYPQAWVPQKTITKGERESHAVIVSNN
jgi:hypothetical protein